MSDSSKNQSDFLCEKQKCCSNIFRKSPNLEIKQKHEKIDNINNDTYIDECVHKRKDSLKTNKRETNINDLMIKNVNSNIANNYSSSSSERNQSTNNLIVKYSERDHNLMNAPNFQKKDTKNWTFSNICYYSNNNKNKINKKGKGSNNNWKMIVIKIQVNIILVTK